MKDTSYSVDPQLKAEFIDDSLDGLKAIPDLVIRLEADPTQEDSVLTIFRTIHSIKGSSAFFELMNVKELSHELETILDLLRKDQLKPTSKIINTLLEGVDELASMLERVQNGENEVCQQENFEKILQKVINIAQTEAIDQKMLWLDLLNELRTFNREEPTDAGILGKKIDTFLSLVSQLAALSVEGQKALVLADRKEAESPISVIMLQEILSKFSHEPLEKEDVEKVGQLLNELTTIIEGKEAEAVLKDALENYVLFVGSIGLDSVAIAYFRDMLDKLKQMVPWKQSIPIETRSKQSEKTTCVESTEQTSETQKEEFAKEKTQLAKTMRVTEESVDGFLSYVGELVVLGEMYQHLYVRAKEISSSSRLSTDLRKINEAFDILSNNLQESILQIRQVPFRTVLQKIPRIVRDIACAESKEIETVIKGETVVADKSIIDTLEAPLVHIVRNAADHGIEFPEDREKAGKNRQGIVQIEITEKGDVIELSVTDNGKGLDYEAIRRKGVSLGLLRPDQKPDQEEIVDLLFTSGVSTATEVTDVSGRGVGMDVVKSNIESIGGTIAVNSEAGQGTQLVLTLPKSIKTQIITGFEVVVGDKHYILPLEKIVRCFRPQEGTVQSTMENVEFVSVEEGIVNIFRVHELFGIENSLSHSPYEGVLIIIEEKKHYAALHVDGIEGIKRVVLKDIEGLPKQHDFFQGGAIMGDSSVAMVICVESVISYISEQEAAGDQTT